MRHTLLTDRSDRARFELSGANAVATLNGLVTNDVAALKPGHGQYAAVLSAKGKIVADVIVLMLTDRLQIHTTPAAAPGLRALLAKFVNPRFATLHEVTATTGEVTVLGTTAAVTLAAASSDSITVEALDALPHFWHVAATIGSRAVTIVRLPSIGSSNECVYAVTSSRDDLAPVRDALHAAGARDDNEALLDRLRVESGFPEWGVDMDENTLLQEANLDALDAVSYTKGCYIGQETVARIHFRGHVNRSLRRLTFVDGVEPPHGAILQDSEHRAIGDVRSTARGEHGNAIGIGMVRHEIEDGSTVDVHWDGGSTTANLTEKTKGAIE